MHAWPNDIIQEHDHVLFEGEPRERFTVTAIHEDRCWIEDSRGQRLIAPLGACILASNVH